MSKLNLKYVTDEKGKRLAVQISIRQWKARLRELEEMEREMKKFYQTKTFGSALKKSFREAEEMMDGKEKTKNARHLIRKL